eukprot:1272517-Rhodomonas_salina.3
MTERGRRKDLEEGRSKRHVDKEMLVGGSSLAEQYHLCQHRTSHGGCRASALSREDATSMTRTETLGSSESRLARTPPEEPAPTIT